MSMPNSPRTSPRKGKYLECKVHMLDDSWQQFWIHPKSLGQVLYDEVIKHLQLLESDYFDLEYKNPEGFCSWLDHEKPVLKQLSPPHVYLKFLVKFYTPDPGLLEEEYTRYLFALQVKRDLETGAMPCQEHTAVLLASYVVQAELGDFLEDEYLDHTYLSQLKLLPQQNDNLLIKIMDHHREHIGQTPEQADFNLLDTARKVELYGIRMHPAKDHEGVALQLAVAHMGVLVFQNYTKINTFSWAKIRKLSFKRKKFLIKLHPEGYGYYKDTVEFYFDSRNECKNFWKKCIEHHAFFRCHVVKKVPRNKTRVVSRGSSFRYSGRTQKQLVEFVRENYVKRPPFERVNSLRSTGSRTGRRKDVNSQPTNSQSYHSLSKHSPRTTSLRTVSSTRSAVATPKTGTLNSRDIHFGRDANQNPSTSSGSHTIDMSRSNENMMDSTQAEVHDESFNSMGRRPRSSPRRDRSYDRSLNRSLDRAHERAQNHYQVSPPMPPPRDDYQRQMESEKGREDFNYSYYQITYDGQGVRDYPHGMGEQNANDNDEIERDFDNVSHDSYPLTESRDSLEGELDAPSGALEGEEVAKLRSELELEFWQREGTHEVTGKGSNKKFAEGEQGGPCLTNMVGESQQGLVGLRVDSSLGGEGSPSLSDEDIHVISVKPLESKDGKKQVEIQIVQKVETTHIVEKVERMNVIHREDSLDNSKTNRTEENLELVRVEFEPEPTVTNDEKSKEPEAVEAENMLHGEEKHDEKQELQNGDVKLTKDENKEVKHVETNGADLNEEIPYYLHKRVVSPPRRGGDLVQLIRSRGRSPSPRRPQMAIMQTKEQEKAQLDKIKSGFTEPPLSPQSKSPGLKRAFDYVVYSKLPPPDSFSSVDDSLSPSLEKEIIAHIKAKIDTPGIDDKQKSAPSTDVEREPARKKSKDEDRLEESVKADTLMESHRSIAFLLQEDVIESDSDHEEVTCLREPDVEEDVNRLLSECGQDSRSISSVSDHDVFDDGDGADRPADETGIGDQDDVACDDDDELIKEEELQKPPLLPRPPIEFDEREEDEYLKSTDTTGDKKLDNKFQDLPSPPPPPPPPPPPLVPEDDSSSLDEDESPPPPPTICEIEDSEDEETTPFHPPALLAPMLSSPDEELTQMSTQMVPSAGGLDIPAICIRAATPVDSPVSEESPPPPPGASPNEPASGVELAAAEDGAARDSSPEIEAEPLAVELHIDEDRLMNELAIEEALEEGRVALAEGETEDSALQRVGAALAEKALREALVQAALIGRPGVDHPPRPHSPLPENPDYFSDSDADVEHPVSEEHADAMDILKESARAHPFEVPRPGDEKRVVFAEHSVSSDEECDYEAEANAEELSRELQEVRAKPFSVPLADDLADQAVHSPNISPDDQVHYDIELEAGELVEALAEEARRKSFCLPLSGDEADPSSPEQEISPEPSTHCEADLELEELAMVLAKEAQAKPYTAGPPVLGEGLPSPPPSSSSSSASSSKEADRDGTSAVQSSADGRPTSCRPPPLLPKPKFDKHTLHQIKDSTTDTFSSSSAQPLVSLSSSGSSNDGQVLVDDLPDPTDILEADVIDPVHEQAPRPRPAVGTTEAPTLAVIGDSSESDAASTDGASKDRNDDDLKDDLEALEKLDAPGLVDSSSEEDVDMAEPGQSTGSTPTALHRDEQRS